MIGCFVQVRQRITAIEPDVWDDGFPCCALYLDPLLVPVQPRPVKPFQGWHYLEAAEVPPDLAGHARSSRRGLALMPARMRRDLAELGLL